MTRQSDAGTRRESDEWLELSVDADHEVVEPVAELFARYGYNEGVAIDEPFTQDPDGDNLALDLTRLVTVRTYVAAADVAPGALAEVRRALWHLGRLRHVGELVVSARREEDWANAWKEHYRPALAGHRTVVRPPWHAYEPADGEVVIVLDPGMAFGTGTHPSTRLGLMAVEDDLRPGDRVLDVGTGSGVLAIAAALLGASRVDAVDREPVAVRSARENAARNGVGDVVRVELGSVAEGGPFTETYDLVVANIIARILVELAPGLARAVRPGGTLALSGIIENHEQAVIRTFSALGLGQKRRYQMDDWVGLVFEFPAA